MLKWINITISQINACVGDISQNTKKLLEVWKEVDKNTHFVVFPELFLTGYPPEDLLFNLTFLKEVKKKIEEITKASNHFSSYVIFGAPYLEKDLYNALFVIGKGEIKGIYYKSFLPNYGVFDEKRYFACEDFPLILDVEGIKLGVSICEDIWHPSYRERLYVLEGVSIFLNISASPYSVEKYVFKENFLKARAQDNLCYLVYVNLVGGQDELVFDGRSLIIAPAGELIFRAKAFEEEVYTVSLDINQVKRIRLLDTRLRDEKKMDPFIKDLSFKEVTIKGLKEVPYFEGKVENNLKEEEEIYKALITGLRDYVVKNNFKSVIIGLSGGIDSALVATLAVDALGRDRVKLLFMPSEFTSKESYEDAKEVAKNLGLKLYQISITPMFKVFRDCFKSTFGFEDFQVADENIQARIRANILFYLSNREGHLVLSTSNKSECAVGYTTIYGDMAGGFAPIKDIYKTQIYKLARYRNTLSYVFPERLFKKPPSAELKPSQTDQEILPPYEILDKILQLYIEKGMSLEEICAKGFNRELVEKIVLMVKKAEYKRKQAPIGIKVSKRAFGKDWRYPVTNRFLG